MPLSHIEATLVFVDIEKLQCENGFRYCLLCSHLCILSLFNDISSLPPSSSYCKVRYALEKGYPTLIVIPSRGIYPSPCHQFGKRPVIVSLVFSLVKYFLLSMFLRIFFEAELIQQTLLCKTGVVLVVSPLPGSG